MLQWWQSVDAASRLSRNATLVAVATLSIAVAAWLFSFLFVAIPGFIVGAAAILMAAFAGFRAADLRSANRASRRE